MKNKTAVIEKKKNLYYWVGRISDWLIYPVILLSLICSFAMFSSKMQNEVPSIFGVSLVRVLTGSMIADGFDPGENVLVKKIDTDTLRKGDTIAFYFASDTVDQEAEKYAIGDKLENGEALPFVDSDEIDYTNRRTVKTFQNNSSKVYFHNIDEIFMLSDGVRLFRTLGASNNGVVDSKLIREDLIVGQYLYTPNWVRALFSFCTTAVGMIILVIVPLSILICMEMLTLLEQINALLLEKKMLDKKVKYDSDECISSNIAIELRNFDKIYYYDIVKSKHKNSAHEYMWSYLKSKNTPKAKLQYTKCMLSKDFYAISRSVYWQYMCTHTNIKTKNIIKKEEQAEIFRYEEKNKILGYQKAEEDL